MRHRKLQPAFALVLVLMTVVIAAVLGMSYLSSASIRMTCSMNMAKMGRAKYLAESGLQHAIHILEVTPWVLEGASAQSQLGPYYADGSDDYYTFYAEAVAGQPGQYVLYATGVSGAVRQKSIATVFRSSDFELHTSCAMLMNAGAANLPSSLELTGNFHVNGNLFNYAKLHGDVSATGSVTDLFGLIDGTITPGADPVDRPGISASDYDLYYADGASRQAIQTTNDTMAEHDPLEKGRSITETNPGGVVVVTPGSGCLTLGSKLDFQGTLVVNGDLTLNGNDVKLTAQDKYPALIVTGKIFVKDNSKTNIYGLVVAEQGIWDSGHTGHSETRLYGGLITDSYGYSLTLHGKHTIDYVAGRAKAFDFRQISGLGRVSVLSYDR